MSIFSSLFSTDNFDELVEKKGEEKLLEICHLGDYFEENRLLPLFKGLPVCERSKWPTLELYTSGHSLTKKWDAIRIEVI